MRNITLEPTGSRDTERCDCCGQNSRTVWGLARREDDAHAAYFVHWTLGRVAENGAHFDLILGAWGENATRDNRYAIALEFRWTDGGPSFTVIDASSRPAGKSELVGRALRRDEVVGTILATDAFELVDAIWLQDSRIAEVRREAG